MLFAFAILFHAIFGFDLEIIVGTVIVKDFGVPGMNKVGVLVKILLNVIGFLCENRKGTIEVLRGIFRWFQQGLAVRETAELAGRGKDPCIDQICKDGMEVVSKSVVVTDISADVVEPQFGADLLKEQIADVEEAFFLQRNMRKWGKGDRDFFFVLVIEQGFLFRLFFAQFIMAGSSPENCVRRSLYFPGFL